MPSKDVVEDTIFHKIIRREISAEIIFEDELVIVVRDINPVSSTHLLVIPKETLPSLREVGESQKTLLGHMLCVLSSLATKAGLDESGYRVVINTGDSGGQTVPQLHMHLLGGREFSWPPG